MKMSEWFSIKGIRSEVKKISWLSKKDWAKNSFVVIMFCFVLGAYFFASDAVIAMLLRMLGLN